jgi:hypothetical protein
VEGEAIVWLSASEKAAAVGDTAERGEERSRESVKRMLEVRDDPVCGISDCKLGIC